jgi:ABC-2 type transport system permease protein
MISLLRLQLMVGLNINAWRMGKKRARHVGMFLLVLLAISPSYGGWVMLQVKAFEFLVAGKVPLQDVQLAGTYAMAMMMALLAGVPVVYSTLLQSRDLSILLPLPYRPWQIVSAKLLVTYAIELIACVALCTPTYALYVRHGFAGPADLPVGVLAMLLLPVLPVAVASTVSLLIAAIPGVGRNRWLWIALVLSAMLSLSLTLSMLSGTGAAGEMTDIVRVRMAQMERVGRLFPGAAFGFRAVTSHGWQAWMQLAAFAGTAACYAGVALLVGQTLYLGPILRGGEGKRRRKGRKAAVAVQTGILRSLVNKEVACVLRDPSVAMNSLGGYISLPILVATYTVMKVQSQGKVDVIGQLMAAAHSPAFQEHMPYVLTGIAMGLAAFGTGSSLFSASYSKDGKRLWTEKCLPIPPQTIMVGKFVDRTRPTWLEAMNDHYRQHFRDRYKTYGEHHGAN